MYMDQNTNNFNRTPRPRMNTYQSSNSYQSRDNKTKEESVDTVYEQFNYQKNWITSEANKDLVKSAEFAGKFMAKNGLTKSKIRSIYGEIKRIQMGTFEKEKSSFYLLKPKMAYALGRDDKNQGLKLFKQIFDRCFEDVTDQNSYYNFCNLIEAILAYHKAYGGKD